MTASRRPQAPADRLMRARLRETLRFPDLSERRALKLAAIPHYTARAHFGIWHRRIGGPDFNLRTGIFTPLYLVELEASDVTLDPQQSIHVHGETGLARVVDAAGNITHLVRDGHHTLLASDGRTIIGRAHLLNVFTRYDPDPAKRKVTQLPSELGLGAAPTRTRTLPQLDDLVPNGRAPDFSEDGERVWHYGQTDPNRHVSGMEYVRALEEFAAEALQRSGHDLRQLYFAKARIIYRKPCFRGEGYRRLAWIREGSPAIVSAAVHKASDPPEARPAVAIELTVATHP